MRRFSCVAAALAAAMLLPISTRTQTGVTPANFVNFEGAQTNPLRLSPDGTRLFAVNTPDSRLSVFDFVDPSEPTLVAEVPVGIEPVSVNPLTRDEAWVVNQVSDSISIVSVPAGIVTDTIHVPDEPADVTFAGASRQYAFVSVARSNEVRVFDTVSHQHLATIPLRGENPRAIAASPDGSRVYVAFALSGNKTTIVPAASAPPQPAPGNGLPAPPQVGLIVRADDSAWSPALVPYTMPDHDVAEIDVATRQVTRYLSGIGTVNLGIAVDPSGDLYVANTEARNLVRFEPNLRGHIIDSRITRVSVDGTSLAIDLNPALNYSLLPNEAAKATAVSQPTAVVTDPAAGAVYVASFGTDRVVRLNAADGTISGIIDVGVTTGAAVNPRTMRGPRGLALNASANRLYVLNRVSNTIGIVDTVNNLLLRELPTGSFDPTPPFIREGRGFLYDAKLSGNGTASCASCHLDADMDLLAWDLGNPDGTMQVVGGLQMHPMKGPMTTQTLRGLNTLQPFHWRGDRADFLAFNSAFDSLMGGSRLADADMAAYRDFINTVRFQPNPHQNLDRTLPASLAGGDPRAGRNTFLNEPFTTGVTCNTCHTEAAAGTNKTIIPGPILQESQPFKVPHLRNLYQKTSFDKAPGAETVGGFGFLHDGSVGSLFEFLSAPVFQNLSNDAVRKRNVAAFLLAFDTGTAPAVGYTRTFNALSITAAATDWTLLEAQAAAGNIDLIIRGTIDRQVHGLLYRPTTQRYESDRSGVGPFTRAQLQDLVLAGDVLTVMGVFPGTGRRIAIDRDVDGVLDGDEGMPLPSTVMHVADVLTTNATGSPQSQFRRRETIFWRVKIVDQNGAAVSGASVDTGTLFGGSTVTTSAATTGADGWALFSRSAQNDPVGTYTVQVTSVTRSEAGYDATADVKNSTTYTLRR